MRSSTTNVNPLIAAVFVIFSFMAALPGGAWAQQARINIDREIITPDGDGQNDSVIIRYYLPEPGQVQIKVYHVQSSDTSLGGKKRLLVRNVISEDLAPGDYEAIWNGTSDTGGSVQNGEYEIELTMTTASGQTFRELTPRLTVEVVPMFTDLRFTPDPFVPGRERGLIQFVLSKPADVLVLVKSPSGRIIMQRRVKNARAETHNVDWDGRDQSGRAVSAQGQYTVQVAAKSRDGKIDDKQTSFFVAPPIDLGKISVTPRSFDPMEVGGAIGTQITFEVEKAKVDYTVRIHDQSGELIWEKLFEWGKTSRQQQLSGKKTFGWGGLNSLTFYGVYEITRDELIDKVDNSGKIVRTSRKTFSDVIALNPFDIEKNQMIYDYRGHPDFARIGNLLKKERRIKDVGDKMSYRGGSWDVINRVIEWRQNPFPNGAYSVRIKVRDVDTQKVSQELGTEVSIISGTPFALCIDPVVLISGIDSRKIKQKNGEKRKFGTRFQTNMCPAKNSLNPVKSSAQSSKKERKRKNVQDMLRQLQAGLGGGFSTQGRGRAVSRTYELKLKGGSLKIGERFSQSVFDPVGMRWLEADEVKEYWDFQPDNIKVKFEVSKDSRITARIRSEKGGIVRKLDDISSLLASDLARAFFEWDGRDDNREQVPAGLYLMDISATDADPASPKTISTTIVILVKNVQRLAMLDLEKSNIRRVDSSTGSFLVTDLYAIPRFLNFNEESGIGGGLDELLSQSTKSAQLTRQQETVEGELKIVMRNNTDQEFTLGWAYTTLSQDQDSSDKLVFRQHKRIVNKRGRESSNVGVREQRVTIEPFDRLPRDRRFAGLGTIWLYAGEGHGREARCSPGREGTNCPVTKIYVRALGHLTETGLHLRNVMAQGMRAVATNARENQ